MLLLGQLPRDSVPRAGGPEVFAAPPEPCGCDWAPYRLLAQSSPQYSQPGIGAWHRGA